MLIWPMWYAILYYMVFKNTFQRRPSSYKTKSEKLLTVVTRFGSRRFSLLDGIFDSQTHSRGLSDYQIDDEPVVFSSHVGVFKEFFWVKLKISLLHHQIFFSKIILKIQNLQIYHPKLKFPRKFSLCLGQALLAVHERQCYTKCILTFNYYRNYW